MMCGVEREDPHDRNHKQHDTMTTNSKISLKLIELINSGMELPEAFDAIFGSGAYKAFAGEIYDNLNA